MLQQFFISQIKGHIEDAKYKYCLPINLIPFFYMIIETFNILGDYDNAILFGGLRWISEPSVVVMLAIISVPIADFVYGHLWKKQLKRFTWYDRLLLSSFTVTLFMWIYIFELFGNLAQLVNNETGQSTGINLLLMLFYVYFSQWLVGHIIKNFYGEGFIAKISAIITSRFQIFLLRTIL